LHVPVLTTQEFYNKINEYIHRVDPNWIYEGWKDDQEEMEHRAFFILYCALLENMN
jgi:hypothetical protein